VQIPREKNCIECGKPFVTTAKTNTCNACLIKPRKIHSPVIIPEIKMLAEKECVDCHKKYIPNGHCQKRCPECMKNKPKAAGVHKSAEKIKPSEIEHFAVSSVAQVKEITDTQILQTLIAIGLIGQDTVKKARNIIRSLQK